MALVLLVIWGSPLPPIFVGVDAALYARVAAELSQRPLHTWCDLQVVLGAQRAAFFEHPPLFFWLLALADRGWGSSAATAAGLARLLASLVAACTGAIALRLGGRQAAGLSLGALLLLPGFVHEAANPMLEMPLLLGLLLATVGLLQPPSWRRSLLFAGGTLMALWTKGPPALMMFGLLASDSWRPLRGSCGVPSASDAYPAPDAAGPPGRWWAAGRLGLATVGLFLATVLAFEAWRHARHLPFWGPTYLQQQLWPSLRQGRHHPSAQVLYYLQPLWRWYAPGLVAAALLGWQRRHLAQLPAARALARLGLVWVTLLVGGFSLPLQKYDWYIHPAAAGFAWMGAAALLLLRPLAENWRPSLRQLRLPAGLPAALLLAASCTYAAGLRLAQTTPALHRSPLQAASRALAACPAPQCGGHRSCRVANCSRLPSWRAEHLAAFYWQAQMLPCAAAAQADACFDGQGLRRPP